MFRQLVDAIKNNNMNAVRSLISEISPKDLNNKDEKGYTVLHQVADTEILEVILASGKISQETIFTKSINGQTALYKAVEENNLEIIPTLLKLPKEVIEIKDHKGYTA